MRPVARLLHLFIDKPSRGGKTPSQFNGLERSLCYTSDRFSGSVSAADAASEASEPSNIGKLVWAGSRTIDVPVLQNLLQLCARTGSIDIGRRCHGLAIQAGLLTDTLTSNILINLYSKCGHVDSARRVFDQLPIRSIVSWNTMISGHTHHGQDTEAMELFTQMHHAGMPSSEFTISSALCACAVKSALVQSQQLHALAIKLSIDSNVFVGTAVLDVYAKCNLINDACWVFNTMPEKSPVTWSSMVAGYVQNNLPEEALTLFRGAQRMGVELTKFTLSASLSGCASLAAATEGTQLHAVTVRAGFHSNLFVATSLIDVYSKCGRIKEAYMVFAELEEKSIILWNAMIAGLSRHARLLEAMILFEKMQQTDIHPNEVTYISILSACGHVGSVEKGRYYFDLLMKDYNVQPNVLHYSCMVDVLGRAGLIYEAREMIDRMPFEATASMWGSLLGSCRIHGDSRLAKVAADHLFQLEPSNAGNHILLSNVYAIKNQWGEVAIARKFLKDSGVKKEMGKSWIESRGKVHVFVVGDISHPKISEIYVKLEDLENELKKFGYKADTQYDLHDVGVEQKEELLRHHSEKLALAFGLISLPSFIPIRINKNLRICGDCHTVMSLASRITAREIVVRDTNRFHHFQDGYCSCRDFW